MRFGNGSRSPVHSFAGGARSPETKGSRLKVSNGDSHMKSESNGAYTNGSSIANGAALPVTFFGHDRGEVTRILIQSLNDLGYHGAAGALSKESGYQVETPTIASFRRAVLQGDWAEAQVLLFGTSSSDHGGGVGLDVDGDHGKSWGTAARPKSASRPTEGFPLAKGADRQYMLFRIRRQKYLELLEQRDLGKALMVLRQELAPLNPNMDELGRLASLMVCQSAKDVMEQADWDGVQGTSRQELLSFLSRSISPSVMIPEHRLATLFQEVKQRWIDDCPYHNSAASPSLFVDHRCDQSDFPSRPYSELRNHSDEVWYLQFSNNGMLLASASKDKTVVIYDTTNNYRAVFSLKEHTSGITHVAWSPDDSKLVTCSAAQENCAKIWDMNTGHCINTIHDFTYPVTAAAFTRDGKNVVIGSQDVQRGLALWDLDGTLIHNWSEENLRVHDLAMSPDGRRLVVLLEKRILVYDFLTYERLHEWTVPGIKHFTSVKISQDSRFMLISMNENRIQLMSIDTGVVVRTFRDHVQRNFIIRSAFGGANENFVVSGSEDSKIYIWRTNGTLIDILDGHSEGCVNALAWHPTDPTVLASAGDDHKVRIWKPAPSERQESGATNGFSR